MIYLKNYFSIFSLIILTSCYTKNDFLKKDKIIEFESNTLMESKPTVKIKTPVYSFVSILGTVLIFSLALSRKKN